MRVTETEPAFLAGGGEMGRLIRAHDWASSPLGPPEDWPLVLQTLTALMLGASQPMFIVWGPERTTLYNDAYSEILAGKHPAVGQPFDEIWHEIWDRDLKPIVERAYAGEALHMDDIPLLMQRRGYPEETHFSFSYTPVRDPAGAVEGFFCPCMEITEQVLEQRRARLRAELTERLRTPGDPADLAFDAAALLARHLKAAQAAYAEVDEAGEYATVIRDWNDGRMSSVAGRHRMRDYGAFISDLAAGRSIAIHDVREDPRTATPDVLKTFAERGIRAFLNIPHFRDGRLSAILAVHAGTPTLWKVADIALAEEVAERVNVAIDRARAEAALRDSEDRFRALVTSTSDMVYHMGPDWVEMRHLDGRGMIADTEAPRVGWMEEYIDPADQPQVSVAIQKAIRTKSMFDLEHRVHRADGTLGWVQSRAVPLLSDDGEIIEWFGAATDITDRKRAEQHQAMLMAELDHRVKNVLAVVQSIVWQSLRGADAAGSDAADRLIGRLSALAQSHSLLAASRWKGADFRDLVDNAVAPYQGEGTSRVRLDGASLRVSPKAAQTLTLVLHELVTNAAKYGALSVPDGFVSVDWTLAGLGDDRRLVFRWEERKGPPLSDPPRRKGFGSRLIERTMAFELDGRATLDFQQAGLRAVFDMPLRAVAAPEGPAVGITRPGPASEPKRGGTLGGKRVLLVEDQHLIAEGMAEGLAAAGCTVAGPEPTLDRAMRAAEAEDVDAAVLDINLSGELVWPVARVLRARGIPVLFATGYSETIDYPPELADVPRIEKPVQPQSLTAALAAAIGGG